MKGKNLWILTEERPKREVIANILYKFSKKCRSCGYHEVEPHEGGEKEKP
jgi:hypothetical protein